MPPEGTFMETPVINIGPREVRKRRLMGIVALAAGSGLAFLSVVLQTPRLLRLVVFFPIWIAGLGLFQAREKTCIALAARGTCNMDAGEESIGDEQLVSQLRSKARAINRRAIITAVVVTLVALAFPA
jgi:hypothetical protein